ncbi:MAG: hypothetical protein JXA25_06120 [Anaerolineales bacterium]|nr:hypothetical protein [Anaerolineales bacterium]
MYWLLSGNIINPLLLGLQCLLWCTGGWLLTILYFKPGKNSLLVGISLGLTLHLVFSNLLGKIVPVGAGFWIAAAIVLGAGILAAVLEKREIPRPTSSDLLPLLWLLGLTLLITLIGRGVGIFDDRKNLALISTMAAGDIPPHFYMNPGFLFSYHYGFQLLGANLMRTGGFFPWSAFDLSKGFTAALAILMCYTWAASFLRSTSGGIWAAFLFTFASGARWLLLLVPQSLLIKAGEHITFWGNSVLSGDSLLDALTSPWVLQGGPPFPIPFAYNSGVFPPFILGAQAGPRSLGCVTLFLALLLIPLLRNWRGSALLSIVFALWALTAEAAFGLILIGFVLYSLLMWAGIAKFPDRILWYRLLLAFVLGGLLSLFQGGTFTEIARNLFLEKGGSALLGNGASPFAFRISPTIISSHLGALSISDPLQLLVGLSEMGAAILMIPLVLWSMKRWLQEGELAGTIFALSALTGILLPLFLAYDVDRDITRLSTYGLMGFVLLSLPALLRWASRLQQRTAAVLLCTWTGLLCFAGLIILGSLLTALPAATFGDDITPLDAAMTHELWNQLEPETLVLDSHEWRSVVVTGRLIRSSQSSFIRLAEWENLVANPVPEEMVRSGYSYVYMDDAWWKQLSQEEKSALEAPCVELLLRKTDNCADCGRRLFALQACGSE